MGVITGATISAVVGLLAALITNRGHDRRLKIQLFNNDQKSEIARLHRLIMEPSKGTWEWILRITEYLETFEAQAYLPDEEKTLAKSLVQKASDKLDELYPEEAEINKIQEQMDQEGEEMFLETLNLDEQKEYEANEYVKKLKREADTHLVRAVSNLANPKGPSKIVRLRLKLRNVRLRKRRRKVKMT
jgi:transcription initiation factor TFIIIB Brf1 subunit/transcription initiation factor TFIIB